MSTQLQRFAKRTLTALAASTLIASSAFAHDEILAPLGGEVLTAGSTFTIRWTVLIPHMLENWDISYSTNGAAGPFLPIATDLPPGDGMAGTPYAYDWTVPDIASDSIVVRVTMDNQGNDYDDDSGNLTIIGTGATASYGCGGNPTGSLTHVSGTPALGNSITFGIDNPLGTQAVGSIPFLAMSTGASPSFPCGTSIPNFGMGIGVGELLIDVSSGVLLQPIFVGSPWMGSGTPTNITVDVPNNAAILGLTVFFQGLLLDPTPAAAARFGLTDAIQVYVGV